MADGKCEITIEAGKVEYRWSMGNKNLPAYEVSTGFLVALQRLIIAGDLVAFSIQRVGITDVYDYRFEARDGVVWNQHVRAPEGGPITSWGSYDEFPLDTVVEEHQKVRRLCQQLIVDFGLTKVEVEWN